MGCIENFVVAGVTRRDSRTRAERVAGTLEEQLAKKISYEKNESSNRQNTVN